MNGVSGSVVVVSGSVGNVIGGRGKAFDFRLFIFTHPYQIY